MKRLCVVLGCLIGTSLCLSILPDSVKKDLFSIHKKVGLEARDIAYDPVTADKVTFYLFTKDNPNEFVGLDVNKLDKLSRRGFKTAFLIHGWTNSREIQWYEDVKNAFLLRKDQDWQVVQVDWKEPASAAYTVASLSTFDVAKHITALIEDLVKKYDVKLDDILVIGHSLGGQTAGFIGKFVQKNLGKKLPRIIALDPAGPLYNTRPANNRLNSTDAEYVEVLHTNGGTLGYYDSIGTIDFYPNGGSLQTGCKQIDLFDLSSVSDPLFCDHRRAWAYFAEAILNPGTFIAKKCSSYSEFKKDKCSNETVDLGDITITAKGDFYFETNKNAPYAKKPVNKGLSVSKLFQI